MITIYHKSNCSTSLKVLSLIKSNIKGPVRIIEYLKEIPTQKELKELVKMLGIKPEGLVRKKEPLYKDEYEGKKITGAGWIKILSQHPILIERPVVVKGTKAIIARPPETVLPFLGIKNK
ncbi:MAG TPA: ArsC/Spx/MgsR family protein [Bacteroidia bacterium]|nr:ArsC/Spx/MgsR family protein [Bacteroidia bacterium]